MRRPHHAVLLPEVFRAQDVLREGLYSEKQLRGPEVQRVLRGVYTLAGRPLTHELRCRAAALLLPEGGVVTGRSQATLLGVELRRWEDDVEVLVPAPAGGRWSAVRGVALRRARTVEPGEPVAGVPAATPERMAFDATTRLPLTEAVANLDALVRAGVVPLPSLRRWLMEVHDPHVAAARQVATLCDPRAESRQESVLRVVLQQAGLPVEPRVTVCDSAGNFVARLDLALPECRVAIEYDGGWHALREQLTKDRRRLRALREAGWEVVHVTAPMLHDPQEVVDAVVRAVARQRRVRHSA